MRLSPCRLALAAVVVLLAFGAAALWRLRRRALAAFAGWGEARAPTCASPAEGAGTPACAALLAPLPFAAGFSGGAAPPAAGAAPAAAFGAAVRLVAVFTAWVGGGSPGGAGALAVPPFAAPALVAAPDDPGLPLAAVWRGAGAGGRPLAVVAVRGTMTPADLAADLRFDERAPVLPAVPPAGVPSGGGASPAGAPPLVHGGIAALYDAARPAFLAALAGAEEVVVAGHSLGAAIAFLLAFDLAGGPAPPRVAAWGVAPPRVGNPAFAAALRARLAAGGSLVNLADVVPSLPWSFMPSLAAPGAPDAFDHVGPVAAFSLPGPDISSCHQAPAYWGGLPSAVWLN